MSASLRDLLQRLTVEFSTAAPPPSDPLLDGTLAPVEGRIPQQKRDERSRVADGELPAQADAVHLPRAFDAPPAAEIPASLANGVSDLPASSAEIVQPGAGAPAPTESPDADRISEIFDRRIAQVEQEWTRGLEQMAELFRLTFASKADVVGLAGRLRDLEAAHVFRGRL